MFFLETVIETFGYLFNVKTCPNAPSHIDNCNVLFFRKTKGDGTQLLNQRLTGLFVTIIPVFTACVGFSLFSSDPLPDVRGFLGIRVNDKVLVDRFFYLFMYLASGCVIGDASVGSGCWALKDDHPAFLAMAVSR